MSGARLEPLTFSNIPQFWNVSNRSGRLRPPGYGEEVILKKYCKGCSIENGQEKGTLAFDYRVLLESLCLDAFEDD